MKSTFFLLFLFLPLIVHSQTPDSVLYHSYTETTSNYKIEEWNISSQNLPKLYLEEKFDNEGRVTQLRFFSSVVIPKTSLCDLAPWYKFEYPTNATIVVTQIDSNGDFGGDIECGNPTKTTYQLTSDYIIKSFSSEMILSEKAKEIWGKQVSDNELNELILQTNQQGAGPDFIFPMLFSYQKLQGVFPVGKDFDIQKVYLSKNIKERVLETLPSKFAH